MEIHRRRFMQVAAALPFAGPILRAFGVTLPPAAPVSPRVELLGWHEVYIGPAREGQIGPARDITVSLGPHPDYAGRGGGRGRTRADIDRDYEALRAKGFRSNGPWLKG